MQRQRNGLVVRANTLLQAAFLARHRWLGRSPYLVEGNITLSFETETKVMRSVYIDEPFDYPLHPVNDPCDAS